MPRAEDGRYVKRGCGSRSRSGSGERGGSEGEGGEGGGGKGGGGEGGGCEGGSGKGGEGGGGEGGEGGGGESGGRRCALSLAARPRPGAGEVENTERSCVERAVAEHATVERPVLGETCGERVASRGRPT